MKPTVGRIVHFHPARADVRSGDSEFYAAIIVKVNDDQRADGFITVDLVTFGSGSIYFQFSVAEHGTQDPGEPCWCWPPRVEGGR